MRLTLYHCCLCTLPPSHIALCLAPAPLGKAAPHSLPPVHPMLPFLSFAHLHTPTFTFALQAASAAARGKDGPGLRIELLQVPPKQRPLQAPPINPLLLLLLAKTAAEPLTHHQILPFNNPIHLELNLGKQASVRQSSQNFSRLSHIPTTTLVFLSCGYYKPKSCGYYLRQKKSVWCSSWRPGVRVSKPP